jgi:maleate isomerase
MFDEFLPKKRVGLLTPTPVTDYAAYQFYRLAPEGMMLVMVSVGLREFTPTDFERAFAPLEEYLAMLVEQEVDMIVQSGVPLGILMGQEGHDHLLARIEKATGVPAISHVLSIVTAAKALGIQKIALANRWNPKTNELLSTFFARKGVQIAGINTHSKVPNPSLKLTCGETLTLAYELGRGALENYPDADGLYIGGGAWLTYPIVDPLEKEFGKPVITNMNALVWHTCHVLDYWKPIQGYGRLLQSV